jgi:hypothetical protein
MHDVLFEMPEDETNVTSAAFLTCSIKMKGGLVPERPEHSMDRKRFLQGKGQDGIW